MSIELLHSTAIISVIALSFLFSKTPLVQYDLQISALLFIALYLIKKGMQLSDKRRLADSLVFTFVIVNVVNTSGGITSPFFFLLYFLLFSLGLLLEPMISIVTSISLILFFLVLAPGNQTPTQLVPLLALALITPFALYLGQEFVKLQSLKRETAETQQDNLLFLSLVIKNHVRSIKQAAENFVGDHDLQTIRQHAGRMEKLIEDYEKKT